MCAKIMCNKSKYKIVASDLDGTLLGKDQAVSQENLIAIAEMNKLGVEFVPATGRSLGEIPDELMNSSDVRYIITSDGAAVWDKTSGEMVITRYIPRDIVKLILDTAYSYNAYPLVHDNGKTYYDKENHKPEILDACHVNRYFRNIINTKTYSKTDYYDTVISSDRVEMFCIFFKSSEVLEECRRIFLKTGQLSVAQSDPYNLEICSSSAGKGNTLAALASKLGVQISDVIAVGDSNNDTGIIKAAGLGLAVDNASAELKLLADKIICNNSEHSAKYILENFVIRNG